MDHMLYEYVKQHGGPLVVLPGHGYMAICRDGAMVTNGPVLQEPPADPRHRLMTRRRYHATLAQRAGSEAAKLELALRPAGGSMYVEPWKWPQTNDWLHAHLGPCPADGPTALKMLREIVAREQQAVAELDAAIGPVTMGVG